MMDSYNTNSNSKQQAYLIRTCSDQSPTAKEKSNQLHFNTHNGHLQKRGVSLGNQKEISYRRNLDELTMIGASPRDSIKHDNIRTAFVVNNNGLLKENEILKLRILELIKENKELKELNALYNQHTPKEEIVDDPVSATVNKRWTLKSKKTVIKELLNDEEDLLSSAKNLKSSQISFNPPIFAYNSPTPNNLSFHKRPEFNQSLDAFNTSQTSQKFKLIHQKTQQEKIIPNLIFNTNSNPTSSRINTLSNQQIQLLLIKKRTEKLFEKYKTFLPSNQSTCLNDPKK